MYPSSLAYKLCATPQTLGGNKTTINSRCNLLIARASFHQDIKSARRPLPSRICKKSRTRLSLKPEKPEICGYDISVDLHAQRSSPALTMAPPWALAAPIAFHVAFGLAADSDLFRQSAPEPTMGKGSHGLTSSLAASWETIADRSAPRVLGQVKPHTCYWSTNAVCRSSAARVPMLY